MRIAELGVAGAQTRVAVEVLGSVTLTCCTAHTAHVVMPAVKIRALTRTQLSADRWLEPGDVAVVPPYVIFEAKEVT